MPLLGPDELLALQQTVQRLAEQLEAARWEAEKARTAFDEGYQKKINSAAQITAAKRQIEKDRLNQEATALKTRQEETERAFQEINAQHETAALKLKQAEQEIVTTASALAAHQPPLATDQVVHPEEGDKLESHSQSTDTIKGQRAGGTPPSPAIAGTGAGFFPVGGLDAKRGGSQAETSAQESTQNAGSKELFVTLRCPYEQDCCLSDIPVIFRDSRLPSALNIMLLWLIREAIYLTVRKRFEGDRGLSTTYSDKEFNQVLKAEKPALVVQQQVVLEFVGRIEQALTTYFKGKMPPTESDDVKVALPFWLQLSSVLVMQFKEGASYFYRLRHAMTDLFELFLNPAQNSRKISVSDLMEATLENTLAHPVYTFKVRILYYIASLRLQRSEDDLLQKESFFTALYTLLESSVRLDKIQGVRDFSMLASTARGFVGDSSRIRAVRDRASSNASIAWNVATAVTAFAVDAVKAARGVNTQGNFGVILERLGVEMDNGKMVSRFEKIAPSAAAAFRV